MESTLFASKCNMCYKWDTGPCFGVPHRPKLSFMTCENDAIDQKHNAFTKGEQKMYIMLETLNNIYIYGN